MTLKKVIDKVIRHHDTKSVCYIQKPLINIYCKRQKIDPQYINQKEMYNIYIARKFERPYTEKMWERILCLKFSQTEWNETYLYNLKFPEYKKFAEFKYKILLNILPCGEKVNRWNKNVSNCCAFCLEKESIMHMLYECKRVRKIWKVVGNCLKLLIQPKHIILGITDPHYVEVNRHICIIIVSYSIYATWCKCSFEKLNYSDINLYQVIISYLAFYSEVDVYTNVRKPAAKKHLKSIGESVIFHLTN